MPLDPEQHKRYSVEETKKALAAFQIGNLDTARTIARDAIDRGLETAFLLKIEGLWLQKNGQLQEALRAFHHARTLDHRDPMILQSIASVLFDMEEASSALKIIDEALKIGPDLLSCHYLRGRILEAIYEYKSALFSYERAEKISPNNASVLAGISSVSFALGEMERAEITCKRALAINSDEPTANIVLARIELENNLTIDAETRLRWLLSQNISQKINALCYSFLGDVLDYKKNTNDAFQAYTLSNKLQSEMRIDLKNKAEKNIEGLKQLEGIINSYSSLSEIKEGCRINQINHVFLLGFMRSGTTLLEQILISHPDVISLEERNILEGCADRFISSASGFQALENLSDSEANELREEYWKVVSETKNIPIKGTFIDKNPLNTVMLPVIRRVFPDAKIIFMIRDPRDVILSCYRRPLTLNTFTYNFLNLETAAILYDLIMKIGIKSIEKGKMQPLLIKYEDLLDDMKGTLLDICKFIHIDYSDVFLKFAGNISGRNIASLSAIQIRKGINRDSIEYWMAYNQQIKNVVGTLSPWISRWGYKQSY